MQRIQAIACTAGAALSPMTEAGLGGSMALGLLAALYWLMDWGTRRHQRGR